MSDDKIMNEFNETIDRCGDAEKFVGNSQLKQGCLAYFIHGWQAGLSQSEPEVSQHYEAIKQRLDAHIRITYDTRIENEALKSENAHLQFQLAEFANVEADCEKTTIEELDIKDKEIEALKADNAALKKTQFTRMLREPEENSDYVDGYFADLGRVYCDIEKDREGKWSVFFRERATGQEAWGDQVDVEALKLQIAELEAATEHLGLTPQQAKDGLIRHKALVSERDRLQSELTQEIEDSKEIQKVRDIYSAENVRLQSACDNLRYTAKQALDALYFHTAHTRPIDSTFSAIAALNTALKEYAK